MQHNPCASLFVVISRNLFLRYGGRFLCALHINESLFWELFRPYNEFLLLLVHMLLIKIVVSFLYFPVKCQVKQYNINCQISTYSNQ